MAPPAWSRDSRPRSGRNPRLGVAAKDSIVATDAWCGCFRLMKREGTSPPPLPPVLSAPPRQARVRHRWLAVCGTIMVAVVALFYFVLPRGLRGFSEDLLTSDQESLFEGFEVERIELAPGWEKTRPWPHEVTDAFQGYVDEWQKCVPAGGNPIYSANLTTFLDPLNSGEGLSEVQWRELRSHLLRGRDLTRKAAELASLPGYGIELFRDFFDPCGVDKAWLSQFVTVKLLCSSALVENRDGNTSVALSTALDALAMNRRHPASDPLAHLVGIAGTSTACRTLNTVARATTSAQLLRAALDELREMRSGVRHEVMKQAQVLVWTGDVRAMQRQGYSVPLDLSKPAIETFDAWIRARAAFPQWMLARLRPDDPRREPTELALKEAETMQRLTWVISARRNPFARPMKDSLLKIQAFFTSPLNVEESGRRELVGAAVYDLACISLASRVMELETSRRPDSVGETCACLPTRRTRRSLHGQFLSARSRQRILLQPGTGRCG